MLDWVKPIKLSRSFLAKAQLSQKTWMKYRKNRAKIMEFEGQIHAFGSQAKDTWQGCRRFTDDLTVRLQQHKGTKYTIHYVLSTQTFI